METEQERTLQAVKTAIQMEIDGKEYYLKVSQESNNELGRKLLESLAAEEDIHRQKFVEIYDTIRSRETWPVILSLPIENEGSRTVFSQAVEELGARAEVLDSELAAIQKAMEMESKTCDFYKDRGTNASYDAEKEFYQSLAAQEKEHHLVLLDYYEYLKDPAGWFVQKERTSLDGS